jgi:hypothetical protein
MALPTSGNASENRIIALLSPTKGLATKSHQHPQIRIDPQIFIHPDAMGRLSL